MKAIAMKATQEDWDSVKDLVKSEKIYFFNVTPYLVTNYGGCLGIVSNVAKVDIQYYERTIYETFDRAIFLDALDIVEEKIWDGGKLEFREKGYINWLNCSETREYRLKPINPEEKKLQELADKLGYKIEKL